MKDMNWPERVAYLENQLADSDRENQRLHGLMAEANAKMMILHNESISLHARLAEAIECCTIKDNRNLWLEIRLQKIMARCADLLDEDQFNELDAMTRTTETVPVAPEAK